MSENTKVCPACGSKIKVFPGIINYVCPYCNTILLFNYDELKSTGEKSILVPFPSTFKINNIFYVIKNSNSNDEILGEKITWLSEKDWVNSGKNEFLAKFFVYGQIRYFTENSFYDKFFLRLLDTTISLDKNKNFVVEEDEGQIKLYTLEPVSDDGTFDQFNTLDKINVNGYFVQEIGEQSVDAFLGGVPFEITNIKKTNYVNLISPSVKPVLMEKLPNSVLFYEGV